MFENTDKPLCKFFAKFFNDDFVLFDIGCSGGIDETWFELDPKLTVFAFDPVIAEIDRLRALNKSAKINYVCGLVHGDGVAIRATKNNWHRFAVKASLKFRQKKAFENGINDNLWHANPLTEDKIYLPDFVATYKIQNIDFLKIDVDGDDFDILLSMEQHLVKKDFLGAAIEVNFHGSNDSNENSFHNVDRFMRKCGFTLCDLTVRRYSKAALPFPYKNSEPSLNYGGTPYQGDAFYVRDPIDMDGNPSINLSADQILKLCCINAIHGQHDAIAELVKVHSAILSNYFDCKALLDALAKRVANGYFGDRSYEEVIAAFEDDDIIFYPVLKKKMSASKS